MVRHTILFFLLLICTSVSGKDTTKDVLDIIVRVNDYWQANNKAEVRSFWDNAAYHTGNMEACKLWLKCSSGSSQSSGGKAGANSLKCKAWLDYSLRWANHNKWMGATEPDSTKWVYKTYGEDQQHVLFGDWQICFQTYIDLYEMFQEVSGGSSWFQEVSGGSSWFQKVSGEVGPEAIARAKEVMGYECRSKAHDYWWWADALYMVMPVMTKMYLLTGDENYLDKLYDNICYSDSLMLDKETGLYFRDARYVYPKHKTNSGKKDFWARGDGWVLAGLAKVLQDLNTVETKSLNSRPSSLNRYKKFFEEKYKRLAKAVAALQQPEGYWTRSMMDPEQAPGCETSGTAFFTYGILWGVNNGLLPQAEYKPVIDKAWQFLTTVALQPSGKVGYVQPIGDRAVPGQVINADSQANFGVGAFLLAASEYYRYLKR